MSGGGNVFVRGQTIGLAENGELIAGVVYEDFNGRSVTAHIAAKPGRRWMTKEFLAVIFDYPFNQLKVEKLIGVVPSGNLEARRLDEHFGFTIEARLKDCHPTGDLLIYTMRRDQCRWLGLWEKLNVARHDAAA